MKRTALAALLSVLLASPAFAQPYVGAAAGQSTFPDCGTASCDRTGTAFKLFGGYMFSPYFGVEAAYFDLGKSTASGFDPFAGNLTGDLRASGIALYGVANAPLGDFALFGKLGVASTRLKAHVDSTFLGSASESKTSVQPAFGVGVGYHFTPNLGVRLEWERFRGELLDEKQDLDLLSLGVAYRF